MKKVVVIGYGSAGSRHAGLLATRGGHVLVSEPDESRAAVAAAEGFEVLPLEESLASSEVAVIASPNHLHRSHLEAALEAGCDILVEKPIAVESAGLQRLLGEARHAGRIVGVGCNVRFVEAVERTNELIRSGDLGRVVRARADAGHDLREWRPGRNFREVYSARPEQGGGVLLDAIHEFDYLYWLLGDVASVVCVAGARSTLELEVEDVACAVLDFESGAVGEVAIDYASGVYTRGIEVVGEEASATWRWGDPDLVVRSRRGVQRVAVAPVSNMYERLIDDFIGAVAERRDPRTPGEDGVRVLKIVEAARAAAAEGRSVTPCELPD